MLKPSLSKYDRKVAALLKEFNYKLKGDVLIQCGIGPNRDQIFRTGIKSHFAAAELLIPIIADEKFRQAFRSIST
jgi:hypothetical protein